MTKCKSCAEKDKEIESFRKKFQEITDRFDKFKYEKDRLIKGIMDDRKIVEIRMGEEIAEVEKQVKEKDRQISESNKKFVSDLKELKKIANKLECIDENCGLCEPEFQFTCDSCKVKDEISKLIKKYEVKG